MPCAVDSHDAAEVGHDMAVARLQELLRAALEFLSGTCRNEIVSGKEDDAIAGRSGRHGHC